MGEFLHEAEKTRKLLNAIPDDALSYQSQPHLWTIAQLASHIAEVYNWYDVTFNQSVFDMATYVYDKGDISQCSVIVNKFEENFLLAKKALEVTNETKLFDQWVMKMGEKELSPPMPRMNVIREFLFNHLYHHRGELIAYLRASGNKVPALYGGTADDKAAINN